MRAKLFYFCSRKVSRDSNLPVSLPQSTTAKQETRPNVVPIMLFDKDNVPNQQLAEKVHKALESDKDTIFVLRGDKSARYESVVAVLDLLKKSGAYRVSIATEMKK